MDKSNGLRRQGIIECQIGRQQPFTAWYRNQVWGFSNQLTEAQRILQKARETIAAEEEYRRHRARKRALALI